LFVCNGPVRGFTFGVFLKPIMADRTGRAAACNSCYVLDLHGVFVLAETTSAIQTPPGFAKAISAWFDPRRGLALGIAMAGVGLGDAVVPQLANILIGRIGWRGAYATLVLLTLVIAFPEAALWMREPRPGEGEWACHGGDHRAP
jgi:Major Facilitator Superfamily